MFNPEMKVVIKDVVNPKVTICEDRFEVKIPHGYTPSQFAYFCKLADALFLEVWHIGMHTVRASLVNDVLHRN